MVVGTRLGNFEIMEEIGRGGMGIVYRARQVSLDRVVALKVLPKEMIDNETAAQRFHREALAMAKLSHPNIVDVIEVGEQDSVHYFAMQFVEGRSLTETIRQRRGLSTERAVEVAAQVADALAHAHEQGIIHRDIKPDNVLIDSHGQAVVTDFGIAKATEGTQLTQTGTAIGTPDYMSPEVLRGNPVDGRADVYSLGVVLFQMVTDRVPFSATTPFDVANRHLTELPPSPRTIAADCPHWLETIILKTLAKTPAERFGSAAEMAAALRAGAPVSAPTMQRPSTVADGLEQAGENDSAGKTGQFRSAVWWLGGAGGLLLIAAFAMMAAMTFNGPSNGPPEGNEGSAIAGSADEAGQPTLVNRGTVPGNAEAATAASPIKVQPSVRQISPVAAVASSVLDGRPKYQPDKATDGRRDTAWVEGASGPGLGEWISVELPTGMYVTEVAMIVGYDKVKNDQYGDRWGLNNRVAMARLTFDDGTAVSSDFDTADRDFQTVAVDPPERSREVRIEIADVTRGRHREWNDTCISEIRIRGYADEP